MAMTIRDYSNPSGHSTPRKYCKYCHRVLYGNYTYNNGYICDVCQKSHSMERYF